MNAPHFNLLPQKRINAIRARMVARWWALGGAAYCAAVVAAAGAYSVSVARADRSGDASGVIAARLEVKRAEKQTLTSHVTDLRKRADAARAVGHHPDWSVMLRHLAVSRPTTLVMERCELKRVETVTRVPAKDSQPETTTTTTTLHLTITGLAEQISDVHEFVGKVEGAGVFDSVRLGQTSAVAPASVGQPSLTKYTIECELAEPQEGGAP